MTDLDTMERVSKFLGCKVQTIERKQPHHKTIYRVRKQGGMKGGLMDLMMKMKPHLCKRRQEQIDTAITKYDAK